MTTSNGNHANNRSKRAAAAAGGSESTEKRARAASSNGGGAYTGLSTGNSSGPIVGGHAVFSNSTPIKITSSAEVKRVFDMEDISIGRHEFSFQKNEKINAHRTVILNVWRIEPMEKEGIRTCFFKSAEGTIVPGCLRGPYVTAFDGVKIGQVARH